ncbi:SGNH hydrolase [Phaeosphaeriaceae sp. SRC1lsM3a]|nr:SGNH hydrolase [Stagonospora sp. SRC1lsM3a]
MYGLKTLALVPLLVFSVSGQSSKIRYMPYGDSITEIVCWRGLLYTQLQAAGYKNVDFVGSGTGQNPSGCSTVTYDRDNEGHSGFLAIDIANKKQLVGWLQKNPADIITMHLGTNDLAQSKPTTDILTAFSTLIDVMRASNPAMKIIVAQIIPNNFMNTAVQALNKAVPAWAVSKNTTASPIWVVDQYTGFPASDLSDGIHPNAAGDARMAAKWFPALEHAIKLMNVTGN